MRTLLRYNRSTQNVSLIGESCGYKQSHWSGAALASDGYLYCISSNGANILYLLAVISMMENLNFFQNMHVQGSLCHSVRLC